MNKVTQKARSISNTDGVLLHPGNK